MSQMKPHEVISPILKHKNDILYLLENHNILILVGQTGSGKSTHLPQILYSSGLFNKVTHNNEPQIIGVTQSRRIAAIQLSHSVASLIGCKIGTTVGYKVELKDCTTKGCTEIKFITEETLIREVLQDPQLLKYSLIILNDVHERNLQTDILLGLLLCLMKKRSDLKIVLCSCNSDIDRLKLYYTFISDKKRIEPVVYNIETISYPIKIFYKKEPVPDYLTACVETAISIHESNSLGLGKILIFLTGQEEVEIVVQQLQDYSYRISNRDDINNLNVYPLYASLEQEKVAAVFEKTKIGKRSCIVSTNVAETSLTISDIAYVIDSGFTKIRMYDCIKDCETLVKVPVSKASAQQRSSRAGKTRDGYVYRLYTEEFYQTLPDHIPPEIQRCELSNVILLFKSLQIDNFLSFPLLSTIPRRNLVSSLEILYALNAIDDKVQLTHIGKLMAKLNLNTRLAKILASEEASGCLDEVIKIVAMVSVGDIFVKPARDAHSLWLNEHLAELCCIEGDLISYLNIYNSFVANGSHSKWAFKRNLHYKNLMHATRLVDKLTKQLRIEGKAFKSCNGNVQLVQKAILSGLFLNIACLNASSEYRTVRGDQLVNLHPLSIINELDQRPKYVTYVDTITTNKCYVRHVMSVELDWLLECGNGYYNYSTDL